MERNGKLDFAGRTFRLSLILLLSVPCFLGVRLSAEDLCSQNPADRSEKELQRLEALKQQGDWPAILQLTTDPAASPDLLYFAGLALAGQSLREDALSVFKRGFEKAPHDYRFPLELAGLWFQQRDLASARTYLRQAMRLKPDDPFLNDFLATVYFLEDNLEAALKYWNRIGKPYVVSVHTDSSLQLDLFEALLAFSPASVLELEELLQTSYRLTSLDVFSECRISLIPKDQQGSFDLKVSTPLKLGLGTEHWTRYLSLIRGLPFQTVEVDFYNLNRVGVVWKSSVRWDPHKKRIASRWTGPYRKNPRWQFRLKMDARDEEWQLNPAFLEGSPDVAFRLRKSEVGLGLDRFIHSASLLQQETSIAVRSIHQSQPFGSFQIDRLSRSVSAVNETRLDHTLFRMPERRLQVDASASLALGRFFGSNGGAFSRLRGKVALETALDVTGRDWRLQTSFSGGKADGALPLDEFFILGLERDNDLFLRGHVGTSAGRKGNAPMGTRFLLLNSEISKNLYRNPFLNLSAAPFLDLGRVSHPGAFGSRGWLLDSGIQLKVQLFGGPALILSVGKGLSRGPTAFYVYMAH